MTCALSRYTENMALRPAQSLEDVWIWITRCLQRRFAILSGEISVYLMDSIWLYSCSILQFDLALSRLCVKYLIRIFNTCRSGRGRVPLGNFTSGPLMFGYLLLPSSFDETGTRVLLASAISAPTIFLV